MSRKERAMELMEKHTLIYINSDFIGNYGELSSEFDEHIEIVAANVEKIEKAIEEDNYSDTIVFCDNRSRKIAHGFYINSRGNVLQIKDSGYSYYFDIIISKKLSETINEYHNTENPLDIIEDVKASILSDVVSEENAIVVYDDTKTEIARFDNSCDFYEYLEYDIQSNAAYYAEVIGTDYRMNILEIGNDTTFNFMGENEEVTFI